jgi:hypothetical protein
MGRSGYREPARVRWATAVSAPAPLERLDLGGTAISQSYRVSGLDQYSGWHEPSG